MLWGSKMLYDSVMELLRRAEFRIGNRLGLGFFWFGDEEVGVWFDGWGCYGGIAGYLGFELLGDC